MTPNVAQTLSPETNPLGFVTGAGNEVSYLSQNFTNIVQNFIAHKDIYIDAPYCGISCNTTVQVNIGPVLAFQCTSLAQYI
jgi:hypothetical protein